jgi:hypothetical protein
MNKRKRNRAGTPFAEAKEDRQGKEGERLRKERGQDRRASTPDTTEKPRANEGTDSTTPDHKEKGTTKDTDSAPAGSKPNPESDRNSRREEGNPAEDARERQPATANNPPDKTRNDFFFVGRQAVKSDVSHVCADGNGLSSVEKEIDQMVEEGFGDELVAEMAVPEGSPCVEKSTLRQDSAQLSAKQIKEVLKEQILESDLAIGSMKPKYLNEKDKSVKSVPQELDKELEEISECDLVIDMTVPEGLLCQVGNAGTHS